jgi:tRNA pseudouridine13 synthase
MLHLSGDYRYLVQRPAGFSWRFVRYSDPNAEISISDAGEALSVNVVEPKDVSAGTEEGEGEQALGLALRFILPSSAYATMLIRELTKEESSTAHHKGLSAICGEG